MQYIEFIQAALRAGITAKFPMDKILFQAPRVEAQVVLPGLLLLVLTIVRLLSRQDVGCNERRSAPREIEDKRGSQYALRG